MVDASQEIHLKRNSILSLLIAFVCSILSIIYNIYATTLFLKHYSPTWLPYQLLSIALLTMTFGVLLSNLLKHNVQKNAQVLLTASIAILAGCMYLNQQENFWIPFIISCVVGTLGQIGDVIIWNIFSLVFGFREFKRITRYITLASPAGIITGSLTIPLILHRYSLESLLLYLIICTAICIICIRALIFLEHSKLKKGPEPSASLFSSPLYVKLVCFTGLVLITQAFTQYIFKYELAQNFKGNELADFQGYFYGFTSAIGIIIGITTTRFLMQYIRLDGLLYLTQSITLLACIIALLHPTLWTITLLAAVKPFFYFNYASVATDILVNILPTTLRNLAKFKLKTRVQPICTIGTYFILLLVASFITPQELLLIIAILLIPSFYFVMQIMNAYKNTLQQQAEFKRFNIVNELAANYSLFSKEVSGEETASQIEVSTVDHTDKSILIPQILKYYIKGTDVHLGKDIVPRLKEGIVKNRNPTFLIRLLAKIPDSESEIALLSLTAQSNIWIRTIIAKELSYRACKFGCTPNLKLSAKNLVKEELDWLNILHHQKSQYSQKAILAEIHSRTILAKKRCLYWLAVATNPVLVNKLIPVLMLSNVTQAALRTKDKAIELLELYVDDPKFFSKVTLIFEEEVKGSSLRHSNVPFKDDWLNRIINAQKNPQNGEEMDLLSKVFSLRQVELFKDLPGETVLAIAEETKQISFKKGDVIFKEGVDADGLYCISSGSVKIVRQGNELSKLKANDFFGELGLIDGAPRSASAIAETDCEILLLEQDTFGRITNDLPEVLWCITHAILRYLRQNLNDKI